MERRLQIFRHRSTQKYIDVSAKIIFSGIDLQVNGLCEINPKEEM